MIIRYLRWIGYEAEVFNVGSYRRKVGLAGIDAGYFAEGREASANREQLAMAVQEMMYEWLQISDGYEQATTPSSSSAPPPQRL
jgi:hypothetical protein